MKKTTEIMRMTFTLLILLTISVTTSAQDGLAIENVFNRFGHEKGCKMVELHDTDFLNCKMHIYKSLTYKSIGASIEPYLNADKKRAKKIREVVENGKVVSGYYMMPALPNGMNRYVLFNKTSAKSGAVIYIEGDLQPNDIIKLCYSRR